MRTSRWHCLNYVLMTLLSTGAHALGVTQWTYIETPPSADIVPVTSITDSTGIWVGGSVNGSPVIARYSSDSQFEFFRFVSLALSTWTS